jgi:hypothetical protein
MRRLTKNTALVMFLVLVCTGTSTTDQKKGSRGRIKVKLSGFQETPAAVSTRGSGTFTARISEDDTKIDFKLTWSDLEGTITQAHIHFGQLSITGGIAAFFCSNLGNGPAGTPACPGPDSGQVEGTLTAANVIGPAGQGIGAGEFAEVLRAIRTGNAYVNVHSTTWPGGEIRAQLPGRGGFFVVHDLCSLHDEDEEEDDH